MSDSNIYIQKEDNSVQIRDLILKYLYHWKWFLLGILLCLIVAKLYLRYSIPIYKAQTTILIKDEDSGGLPSELSAFKDLGLTGSKNVLDDEIEIIKSRSLLEKTIKEGQFNISYIIEGRIKSSEAYKQTPVEIIFKEKNENFYLIDTILSVDVVNKDRYELFNAENVSLGQFKFGKTIESKQLGDYTIVKATPKVLSRNRMKPIEGKILISLTSLEKSIDKFKSKIGVATLNKFTNVLEISCVDPVDKKAEDIVNQLVNIYNREAITDKNLISENTSKFINERLEIITKELQGVEKEAEFYKNKNKITDLPTESELYLRNASEYKNGSITVITQLKVVGLMIDFLNKNKNSDVIPANIVPDDNNSSVLIGDYNNLVIERDRMLKGSSNDNPAVIRINDKISSLKNSISESLFRLKSSLTVKSNDISRQENMLNGKIAQIPRQEREYRNIFRQQQIKEELYLYLFKKREETAITLAATAPNSKVVDSAYSSGLPVSPNKTFIYLIALLLGVVIPFSVIYVKNVLDTKVKNRQDVDSVIKAPFIGDVPHSDAHNEIIQPSSRTSSAEAIRIVRTNLEFLLNSVNENKAKTIFLTSTLPKEGKTFIAINLAATIAISGKKVLLIGMDIRNPKLDEYVKLPSRGLTNFLSSNEANINDYIVNQKGYESFDILPAGIIPPNPAELLMSKKVEGMFNLLKSQYDYIVVDTAPVSLVTDTLLISKNADAFIYVVRSNYLEKALLKIPQALYKENKLPNMSVLLNDTNTINGYGYGYGQEVAKKPWYKKIFSLSIFS